MLELLFDFWRMYSFKIDSMFDFSIMSLAKIRGELFFQLKMKRTIRRSICPRTILSRLCLSRGSFIIQGKY